MALIQIKGKVDSVYAHYNPTSVKFECGYKWEDPEAGSGTNFLQGPDWHFMEVPTMKLELRFDDYKPFKEPVEFTTAQSIRKIHEMAHPNQGGSGYEEPDPVMVNFGSFIFKGYIKKIETEITATDDSFKPTRAVVTLDIVRSHKTEGDYTQFLDF